MKKVNYIIGFAAISLALLVIASNGCKKDDDGTAIMNVKMSSTITSRDATVYEQVNVDIVKVSIHTSGDSSATSGWFDLETNTGIYDLMDFLANDTLLAFDSLMQIQKVSQIRLLLGSNNSVVDDGVEYDLSVPSGMSSGLKLQVHADMEPDKTYIITLQFDAAQSVKKTGIDTYKLSPVINTTVEEI